MSEKRMLKFRLWDIPLSCLDERVVVSARFSPGADHIAMQEGRIMLWTLVDEDFVLRDRTFLILGTGHKITVPFRYIGTVHERNFVWHIFEVETP